MVKNPVGSETAVNCAVGQMPPLVGDNDTDRDDAGVKATGNVK